MIPEQRKTLEQAVPCLAKRFDATAKRAWQLLEEKDSSLKELLSSRENPKTRQEVNQWWKKYKSDFPQLNLRAFCRVSSPAKLPESTYDQFICLVWLTARFQIEQRQAKRKEEISRKIKEPKFAWWQRFIRWIEEKWRNIIF